MPRVQYQTNRVDSFGGTIGEWKRLYSLFTRREARYNNTIPVSNDNNNIIIIIIIN
jgi:hypothetical protein